MRGLIFNCKHSFIDYNLIIEKKNIQPPSKKKVKDSVPFMNGSYDFSTVATNGEIIYAEREINVTFGLPTHSKEELYSLYSKILLWLQDTSKTQLIFDDIPGCFFMAEVENAPSFEEMLIFGKLNVSFACEPFKQGIDYVGEELWDNFDFEVDYIQDTEFDVVGTKNITIYNPGRSIIPKINATSNMTITLNSYTSNIKSGDNTDWRFKLKNGANNIAINGTGHIKFMFRKELL